MKPTSLFPGTVFLMFSLSFFVSCRKPAGQQNGRQQQEKTVQDQPAWLKQIISDFEKEPPANPPVKIYSYLFKNEPVYYVTSRCCDIPGQVYNANGKQLCQPDGGITGRGDGKCPDFFETRTAEKLVWEDPRK